jgi:predicted RNA-binding protein with RPS1 domain
VLLRRRQEGLEAVVVLLRNRIELVIVAPRAADGQAQERQADDVGPLGQHLVAAPGHFLVSRVAPHRAQAVEAGRHLRFAIRRIELIAGQLLQDETVVRLVPVEGADDVVAVAPGPEQVVVVLEAFRLGEADHVEPVPGPALAVAGARKEPVDEALVGVRLLVALERRCLHGRRREAGQVERHPPDQFGAARLRRGREALALELLEDEAVDARARPGGVPDLRESRPPDGPEGPEVARRRFRRAGSEEAGVEQEGSEHGRRHGSLLLPRELSAIGGAISMDSTGEPGAFRVSFPLGMKPDPPLPGFGPEGDQDQIRISDAELERLMGLGGKAAEPPRAFESLETGERVRGRVIEIQRDAILVELDGKTLGTIDPQEFGEEPLPAIGSTVQAEFVRYDRAKELCLLSIRAVRTEVAWEELRLGLEIEGKAVEATKGGLVLDIHGLRGFLPISRIELERVDDLEPYLGRKLRCTVEEIDRAARKVVVSRRAILERERESERSRAYTRIKPGDVLTGRVARLTEHGPSSTWARSTASSTPRSSANGRRRSREVRAASNPDRWWRSRSSPSTRRAAGWVSTSGAWPAVPSRA